jgi:hypothetical protein
MWVGHDLPVLLPLHPASTASAFSGVDVADDFATAMRRFAAESAKYISTLAAPAGATRFYCQ